MGGTLSKPDPSRTLEVIGAGHSRTGTSSMQLTFEKLLNGPVYHAGTQMWLSFDEERVKLWTEASNAKFIEKDKKRTLELVREASKGFVGIVDSMPWMFLPELMELYPNARVVLHTRDAQKWWESFQGAAGQIPWYFRVISYPAPGLKWVPDFLVGYFMQMDIFAKKAGYPPGQYGPRVIEKWDEYVKEIVPKEKLLVMDVKDGWKPLAKFLRKPVPKEPFPWTNEREATERQAKYLIVTCLKLWAQWFSTAGVVGAGAYVGWRYWRRRFM